MPSLFPGLQQQGSIMGLPQGWSFGDPWGGMGFGSALGGLGQGGTGAGNAPPGPSLAGDLGPRPGTGAGLDATGPSWGGEAPGGQVWGHTSEGLGQTPQRYSDWPEWQQQSFNALLGGMTGIMAPGLGQAVGLGSDVADARANGAGWGQALGGAAAGALGIPSANSFIDWLVGAFGSNDDQGEAPPIGSDELIAGMAPEPEVPRGTIPPPRPGMDALGFYGQDPVTAGNLLHNWNTAGFYSDRYGGSGSPETDPWYQSVFGWAGALDGGI